MKRIGVIVVGFFIAGLAGFFLLSNSSDNLLKSASTSDNSSIQNELTQKAKPVGMKDTVENLVSSQELNALKERAKAAQKDLDLLAVEFNKSLENESEKKKIQAKYVLQTQEYNKLVLQIVRQAKLAEQESRK